MHWRLSRFVLLACLGALIVTSCGPDETADDQPGETPPPASTAAPDDAPSSTARAPAKASATVTDDGGASVVIPAGSVMDGQAVTVTTLATLEGLPPTGDPAAFAGGIALEPHGATFTTPVMISIPLTRQQAAGRELRLYYWDGARDAWEETDFFATVDAGGWTASGDVMHFSYYILQPSQVEAESDGIFGDIDGLVFTSTAAGDDLATVTNAVFDEVVAHVNARFTLGQATPLDPPIPDGYNCYAPVGLYFAFDHGGADGIPRTLVETIGDIENVEFLIEYFRPVDATKKVGELENEVQGTFTVDVYWRSTPPALSLDASRTKLWGGDSSSLSATLMCGDTGMEEQPIGFSLPTGSRSGSLGPASDDTDGNGLARAIFTSGPSAPGPVVVEASYKWASQKRDARLTITDTAKLAVGALTGTWTVRGREASRGCVDSKDDGVVSGEAKVYFEQTGETFTGFGKFPRDSDLIVGTFERRGATGFVIEGTSHYVEVSTQADDDDDSACSRGYSCDTWETYGVATFKGTGSMETQTIDFTWHGRDTEGDTCVFDGTGRATYTSP